jgi:short subunit dehydrogenase-like uncharacterized protein
MQQFRLDGFGFHGVSQKRQILVGARTHTAKRVAELNAATGLPRDWPLPRSERARVRTEAASEWFRRQARQVDRPFVMGSYNTRVVRRSAVLLDYRPSVRLSRDLA